jgi:hypothetical protein
MKVFLRALALVMLLAGSQLALANPVLCSPGYQDSTCPTPIAKGPIPQPQCSSGAGWTTTSYPVWQGAYWSSPGCSYQAPPSCPPGYYAASGPSWNGSSWVGLNCQPTAPPPPPPPAGHVLIATTTTNSCGTLGTFNTYADGTYDASNPDWTQSFSGTWDQMFNSGTAYMNANYARYYGQTYITQPSDPTTATNYLSRFFFVNNPWACGGGVG